MDAALEEEDFHVIDYARSHGICIDYTTEQLHIGEIHVPSSNDIQHDFEDPSDTAITNAISKLIKEPLTLNKEAALLLKTVDSLQQAPAGDLPMEDRRRWILGLKQELPILRTDHELDLLGFGSVALPHFRDLKIPSEVTQKEDDEGLEWPPKYLTYPLQCDKRVNSEKLAVSKEALLYLQDAIRDTYTAEDFDNIMAESLQYKPVR